MKLIKINTDHYVIVDDSEIKEGDWMYNSDREPSILQCIGKGSLRGWEKITHSTQSLEFGWAQEGRDIVSKKVYDKVQSLSLSEVKELIGEVDVEKKAEEISIKRIPTDIFPDCNVERRWIFEGIVEGYNQALEDNKDKKYTEEIFDTAIQVVGSDKVTTIRDFLLEHIQPKTEWEVEYDENGKLKLV